MKQKTFRREYVCETMTKIKVEIKKNTSIMGMVRKERREGKWILINFCLILQLFC